MFCLTVGNKLINNGPGQGTIGTDPTELLVKLANRKPFLALEQYSSHSFPVATFFSDVRKEMKLELCEKKYLFSALA